MDSTSLDQPLEEVRPKSPWTPSYSVTSQGSPLSHSAELATTQSPPTPDIIIDDQFVDKPSTAISVGADSTPLSDERDMDGTNEAEVAEDIMDQESHPAHGLGINVIVTDEQAKILEEVEGVPDATDEPNAGVLEPHDTVIVSPSCFVVTQLLTLHIAGYNEHSDTP